MSGYIRCGRCSWSRIYARYSIVRIPHYCPACGARVERERNLRPDSPGLQSWRAVADRLAPEAGHDGPSGPADARP